MKKRWFCLLLAALMALSLLPTGALAADPADLQYSIADGSVTITGCDGARGELVIPSAIEGYPVRAIGAAAFNGCAYLTRVVIPEGVTPYLPRAEEELRAVLRGESLLRPEDFAWEKQQL